MESKDIQARVQNMVNEMDAPDRIMEFIQAQDPALLQEWVGNDPSNASNLAGQLLKSFQPGYSLTVEFLLDLGVKIDERAAWQAWFNCVMTYQFNCVMTWGRGLENGESVDEESQIEEELFEVLSRREIGRFSPLGKHWSPAHMVVSVLRLHPDMLVDRLGKLAECGYQMDPVDEIGETPLLLAAWHHHVQAAQWLLDHGADPARNTSSGNGLIQYFTRESDLGEKDGWARAMKILEACHRAGYDIAPLFEKTKEAPLELVKFGRALVDGGHLENSVKKASSNMKPRRI